MAEFEDSGLDPTPRRESLFTPSGMGRGMGLSTEWRVRQLSAELGEAKEEIEQARAEISRMRVAESQNKMIFIKPKKIKKFTGNDGEYSVEEFIREIKGEGDVNFIIDHLEGEAKKEVRCCGTRCDNTDTVFQILLDAFGDKRKLPTLMAAFADRRQGSRETVRSYANDLHAKFKLVRGKQAVSGRSVSQEDLLIDHFVEGIHDRSLVLDLRRQMAKGVQTFSELRKLAVEWEEVQAPVRRVTASVVTSERDEVAKLREEINILKKSQPQKYQDRKIICFRCGETGHISKYCRNQRIQKVGLNGKPTV